jgi:hypothetical protein
MSEKIILSNKAALFALYSRSFGLFVWSHGVAGAANWPRGSMHGQEHRQTHPHL